MRLEDELKKKQEAEQLIELLAREEMELRKRIKRTESMQAEVMFCSFLIFCVLC